MKISFYFQHFLLLTLFNALLSLSINKDNYELEETIFDYNISDNFINTIDLKKDKNITLNVSYTFGRNLFLSIKTLNNKTFNVSCSDIKELNKEDTKEFIKTIDMLTFKKDELLAIDIGSKENNSIEIINIVDEDKNKYYLIKEIDKTYTINNSNFVYYIKNNEIENKKLVIKLKFKDEINAKMYNSLIRLSSNNTDYIPRVFNFNKSLYLKEDFKGKEKTIEVSEDKGNKKLDIVAFIFSIDPESIVDEYSVTLSIEEKNDIMNEFLIGSIILALIFAVITFFLIRRKKNINEKNIEDDFYKEENKDEDDKN